MELGYSRITLLISFTKAVWQHYLPYRHSYPDNDRDSSLVADIMLSRFLLMYYTCIVVLISTMYVSLHVYLGSLEGVCSNLRLSIYILYIKSLNYT